MAALERGGVNENQVIAWVASGAISVVVGALLARVLSPKVAAAVTPVVIVMAHRAFDATLAPELRRFLR